MDTMSAFAMGEVNRGKEPMVFDWDKAAQLIKDSGTSKASAGLSGDWGSTGGDILIDGKIPEDEYTYLLSTWATPELDINGETVDCYIMGSKTDWDEKTFWPESAKLILFGKGEKQ